MPLMLLSNPALDLAILGNPKETGVKDGKVWADEQALNQRLEKQRKRWKQKTGTESLIYHGFYETKKWKPDKGALIDPNAPAKPQRWFKHPLKWETIQQQLVKEQQRKKKASRRRKRSATSLSSRRWYTAADLVRVLKKNPSKTRKARSMAKKTKKTRRPFSVRKRAMLRRLLKRLTKKRFRLALGRRKKPGYYKLLAASAIRRRGGYRRIRAYGIPWSGRYGNYRVKSRIAYRKGRRYKVIKKIFTNPEITTTVAVPQSTSPVIKTNPRRRTRRWAYTARKARRMLRRRIRSNPQRIAQEFKNIPNAIRQTFTGKNAVKNIAFAAIAAIGTAFIGSKLYEARNQLSSGSALRRFLDNNKWTGAVVPALIGVLAGAFIKNAQLKGALVTGAVAATGLNLIRPTWFEELNARVFKGTGSYDIVPAYAGTGAYEDVPAYTGTGTYDTVPAYAGTGTYDTVPAYAGTGADDLFSADDLAADDLFAEGDLAADDLAADDLAADDLADDTVLAGLGSYLADSVAGAGSYLS